MQGVYCIIFGMSKPVYELHKPYGTRGKLEYIAIAIKDGKQHAYMKCEGECAKRIHDPRPFGTRFAGYMSEKSFEEMIFVDLL